MEIVGLIAKAKTFATEAHKGSLYGDLPYTVHLEMVTKNIEDWLYNHGLNSFSAFTFDELVAAGWLHDTVEDCMGINFKTIRDEFGWKVGKLVWSVTVEPGKTRKIRNTKTYPKIRATDAAVFLKLCDRLANVQYGATHNPNKLKMYRSEHPVFEAALRIPDEFEDLWVDLNKLLNNKDK